MKALNQTLEIFSFSGETNKVPLHKNTKNCELFRDFDYRKLVPIQKKHDIRDQHKKIHLKVYSQSYNSSHQNVSRRDDQKESFKRGSTIVPIWHT